MLGVLQRRLQSPDFVKRKARTSCDLFYGVALGKHGLVQNGAGQAELGPRRKKENFLAGAGKLL